MTVDLSQFDEALERQESGIDVPILGMDGKLIGLTIKVAGPDSERARKAREKLHDEAVAGQKLAPLTPAEVAARGTRFLALITIDWSPKVKMGGDEMECTEANAIRVYEKYRFIREQVDAAAGSRAAFMLASSSSSATPSKPQ